MHLSSTTLITLASAVSFHVLGVSATVVTDDCGTDPTPPTNLNVSASCCASLQKTLGSIVTTPDSVFFQVSTSSYWALQNQEVHPWCIVLPTNTTEVSNTIDALNQLRETGLECPFAIRSGGHTPWVGAASIQDGVQVDLGQLKHVVVSADQQTTAIGPGARWFDVYSTLDPLGLTVPGGRVATVGVGGLITGGGMSFFPRHGWTADNIVEYECVLYDGTVVSVSASSEPDLFVALKGGSNNFCVVTGFQISTFAQANFLGGMNFHPITVKNASLAAFVNFAGQENYDEHAAVIIAYTWTVLTGGWVVSTNLEYTAPVAQPPVLQELLTLQPRFASTMRTSNMTDFSSEVAKQAPDGRRQIMYTSTWRNDLATLAAIIDLGEQYQHLVTNASGLQWSFALQPLVTLMTSRSAATGGNSLGLDGSEGNLIIGLLTVSYDAASDDAAILSAVTDFFAAANSLAESKGTRHPFQYLNYAYKTQDPISGYGPASVARLRAASAKYDPYGVFQKQVPGGFKLP